MSRKKLVVSSLFLALLLTACSSSKTEKVSESSQAAPAKKTPECSTDEFASGSQWIKGQLKAFGDDNPEKAYSYASESFRQRNSIEMFTAVIVGQYSMLLNLQSYEILSCEKAEEQFLFKGKLKDKADKNYTMQYLLSRVNGKWGVDGAQVSEKLDRINY